MPICCLINSKCSQVIRVWDFDTGRLVSEFGSTHAVTCMTFDLTGRRYTQIGSRNVLLLHKHPVKLTFYRLITGGRDGCLKIWNYNNGQCLKTLKKGEILCLSTETWDLELMSPVPPVDGDCRAVLDCIFLRVHSNLWVKMQVFCFGRV